MTTTLVRCDERCIYREQCREAVRNREPVACERSYTVPVMDYDEARQAGFRTASARRASRPGSEMAYGAFEGDARQGQRVKRGLYLMERTQGDGPVVLAQNFVRL